MKWKSLKNSSVDTAVRSLFESIKIGYSYENLTSCHLCVNRDVHQNFLHRCVTSDAGLYSEQLQRLKEEEERQHLEEMSEDEYDALSEEQKAAVDQQRLEVKKQRLQRSTVHSLLYTSFTYIFATVLL